MAKTHSIGERLMEAFGTDDKAIIAEKLGFNSVQAVYKVINGERQLDFEKLQRFRDYTKRSIDWLLTGQEEQAAEPPEEATLDDVLRHTVREVVLDEFSKGTFDRVLSERLRKIIREGAEASATEVQDLGAIDIFDIEASVKRHDDPRSVLDEWYRHDHLPVPEEVNTLRFSGWDKFTLEEKIREIRAFREIRERQRERQRHAPKDPKHS